MIDTSRNAIIRILMERDNLTKREAEELITDCRNALESGDYDAIYHYLGLEDDYIFGII